MELGFYLEESVVDGIHHIYFRYQKDYFFDEVGEFLKCAKKLVEEVWAPIVVWT